jgi:hypothetical protein
MRQFFKFGCLGLAGLFLMFWIITMVAGLRDFSKKMNQEEEKEKAFAKMTPAQHLSQAESGLKPGATLSMISDALRNVKAVPPSAPEATQAKATEKLLVKAQSLAKSQEAAQLEKERRAKLSPLALANEDTNIVKLTWRKGGFGSVMIATFVIRNNSPMDVKDLEIRCEHSAPSGTVIDENTRTIYDVVKARSTRTFSNVDMGFIHSQAASTSCVVQSLQLASER